MQILFQSHHADVSDRMRERARRAVEKLGDRLARAVDAVIRFEQDGPLRRVEILMHSKGRRMVANGTAKFYGPALNEALERLEAQARQRKRTPKARVHRLQRA
jgi:ribosome-associated translation inhibitor RaiA